jgi:hypothetical protein
MYFILGLLSIKAIQNIQRFRNKKEKEEERRRPNKNEE